MERKHPILIAAENYNAFSKFGNTRKPLFAPGEITKLLTTEPTMQTIDVMNNLIEEAEFWGDKTGYLQMPDVVASKVNLLNTEYGLWLDCNGCITASPLHDFETRANFCLLIAAALESEQ